MFCIDSSGPNRTKGSSTDAEIPRGRNIALGETFFNARYHARRYRRWGQFDSGRVIHTWQIIRISIRFAHLAFHLCNLDVAQIVGDVA